MVIFEKYGIKISINMMFWHIFRVLPTKKYPLTWGYLLRLGWLRLRGRLVRDWLGWFLYECREFCLGSSSHHQDHLLCRARYYGCWFGYIHLLGARVRRRVFYVRGEARVGGSWRVGQIRCFLLDCQFCVRHCRSRSWFARRAVLRLVFLAAEPRQNWWWYC